jgi:hypothetical protein
MEYHIASQPHYFIENKAYIPRTAWFYAQKVYGKEPRLLLIELWPGSWQIRLLHIIYCPLKKLFRINFQKLLIRNSPCANQ